ncbi:HSP20-like chaperone [Ramaria rubella]|nr:HSP20-like chaperone [Ramaria rubella]
MSLTRNLFHEFRPFFRLFDEVSRTHGHPSYAFSGRPFDRYFDDFPRSRYPSVDLAEQGNEYVIEAEVPGIKKENLDVRIGDSGRSITIEGRTFARSASQVESPSASDQKDSEVSQEKEITQSSSDTTSPMPISSERDSFSHFTRTVWLPRPVNGSKVSGSLTDGILTLRIPKAEEQNVVKVDIQ